MANDMQQAVVAAQELQEWQEKTSTSLNSNTLEDKPSGEESTSIILFILRYTKATKNIKQKN